MRRLRFFPSKTRGGKELPSNSALDSPSVINRLATPPHAIKFDMSRVIDDATLAMNVTHDDASTLFDDNVPLGEFLDEQIATVRARSDHLHLRASPYPHWIGAKWPSSLEPAP